MSVSMHMASMHMTGSDGILTVSREHLPGLVWLVAAPLTVWVLICAARALAARGQPTAVRFVNRMGELSLVARAALFASLVGAGVHAAIVPSHWIEDRTRAWLFVIDTAAFVLAMGWTLTLRPGWRLVTLLVLGGTTGAYVFYLIRGWESLDLVGLVTTTIELATALALLDPRQPAVGPARSRERWVAAAALPVALVSLLGTVAVASATHDGAADQHHFADGMAHSPGMTGMAGMDGMTQGPGRTFALTTTSPAGNITWPQPMAAMGPGMRMATGHCMTSPTAAQQRAAVDLVDKTVAAAAPHRSLRAAKAAGYVPVTPTGLKIVHYVNPSLYAEGPALDPSAIPALVYVNTDHGAVLSAAMYIVPPGAGDQRPPQPGGRLTQWHVHTNLCFRDGVVVGIDAGSCPAGGVTKVTQPLMHVWLAPVPGGPLAVDPNGLEQVLAASRLPPLTKPNGTA